MEHFIGSFFLDFLVHEMRIKGEEERRDRHRGGDAVFTAHKGEDAHLHARLLTVHVRHRQNTPVCCPAAEIWHLFPTKELTSTINDHVILLFKPASSLRSKYLSRANLNGERCMLTLSLSAGASQEKQPRLLSFPDPLLRPSRGEQSRNTRESKPCLQQKKKHPRRTTNYKDLMIN